MIVVFVFVKFFFLLIYLSFTLALNLLKFIFKFGANVVDPLLEFLIVEIYFVVI